MNNQMVLVIGGPGGSGSSTIAKRLANFFKIDEMYGGEYFREKAKSNGYETLELFMQGANQSMIKEIDQRVDDRCRELAKHGGVVITSKSFAGIATIENIPCTAKIWITASLEERVNRVLSKRRIRNPIKKMVLKKQIRENLKFRYKYDSNRYLELYDMDYNSPEKYNDLVIDSSLQSPDETFNLIVNFINNGKVKK